MSRRHKILAILAVTHIALVICGATQCRIYAPRNVVGRLLHVYGSYTGSESSYGFFAPGVSPEFRISFVFHDAQGQSWKQTLDENTHGEEMLRVSGIASGLPGLPEAERDLLLQSLAAAKFAENPQVSSVTVQLELFGVEYTADDVNFPTMEEFLAGKKPDWQLMYFNQFNRDELEAPEPGFEPKPGTESLAAAPRYEGFDEFDPALQQERTSRDEKAAAVEAAKADKNEGVQDQPAKDVNVAPVALDTTTATEPGPDVVPEVKTTKGVKVDQKDPVKASARQHRATKSTPAKKTSKKPTRAAAAKSVKPAAKPRARHDSQAVSRPRVTTRPTVRPEIPAFVDGPEFEPQPRQEADFYLDPAVELPETDA